MTSKQRAYLRSLANRIPALYQIGKNGIDDSFVNQILDALEANELIKIHVLENAQKSPREMCEELTEKTASHPVQVIGSKFVIYKESIHKKKIELPK